LKPVIVFSHANGFPTGVYTQLFKVWRQAGYVVHAIDQYGHDPRYPVTSNWPHLRDQLIEFMTHDVRRPAFLVGHSLGGMVSMLAASREPSWVRGVVLLDSPVIGGWRARALQLAKVTGLVHRVTPGRIAQKRRTTWPDREAVSQHFLSKPVFARWDPSVLADYVKHGVVKRGKSFQLSFDREIETRIYNTLPHHIERLLQRRPLQCPLAFVGGRESVELRQAGVVYTQRLAGPRYVMTPGTHLFPMEHPQATADTVLRLIDSMGGAQTTHV
jgi:pimeloyl-ACP methyl ester carboxylesterase